MIKLSWKLSSNLEGKSMFNTTMSSDHSVKVSKATKQMVNKYQLGTLLGQGTYGKVYECIDTETNKIYALKEFSKDNPKTNSYFNKEVEMLRKLNHENIVKYNSSFNVKKSLYILMEHCGYFSLKVYVKEKVKLSEEEARPIFLSLAKAVGYCHDKLIAHRDIKL